jgi:thiamine pyrophosphate-dependent acetolactate synthase large subunit-like protein
VNRALSFATSDPKGPVYLCGAREPMEEDLEQYSLNQEYWEPIEPAGLSPSAVEKIATALVNAKEPLIITGYCGRNQKCPNELVKLADKIKGLRVLDTGGSDMCFPGWSFFHHGFCTKLSVRKYNLTLPSKSSWLAFCSIW